MQDLHISQNRTETNICRVIEQPKNEKKKDKDKEEDKQLRLIR